MRVPFMHLQVVRMDWSERPDRVCRADRAWRADRVCRADRVWRADSTAGTKGNQNAS